MVLLLYNPNMLANSSLSGELSEGRLLRESYVWSGCRRDNCLSEAKHEVGVLKLQFPERTITKVKHHLRMRKSREVPFSDLVVRRRIETKVSRLSLKIHTSQREHIFSDGRSFRTVNKTVVRTSSTSADPAC